tara:strand:- start:6922 stop:7044 length:123 start_codon:yes stop_codon:yes gene_type:complete
MPVQKKAVQKTLCLSKKKDHEQELTAKTKPAQGGFGVMTV